MKNQFGSLSRLQLHAVLEGNRTVLKDVEFTAPFKVMRPFYEKKGIMTVMLQAASAGIMAGDRQAFAIRVDDGAGMEFVSQAYEKIHKMDEGEAERNTVIHIGKEASFHFMPLPAIPFAGSAFQNTTEVFLTDETSRFVMREVLSCGRAARGERFAYRFYKNRISIRQAGQLIYRDNTCFLPDSWDMEGFGMYESFTHLASLVVCNHSVSAEQVSEIRRILDDAADMEGGVTQNGEKLTVIKILGCTAQGLLDRMEEILSYIDLA